MELKKSEIEELMQKFDDSNIAEMEIKTEGVEIVLKKQRPEPAPERPQLPPPMPMFMPMPGMAPAQIETAPTQNTAPARVAEKEVETCEAVSYTHLRAHET